MSKKTGTTNLTDDGGSQPPTKQPEERLVPAGKRAKRDIISGSKPPEPKDQRKIPAAGPPAAEPDAAGGA